VTGAVLFAFVFAPLDPPEELHAAAASISSETEAHVADFLKLRMGSSDLDVDG
jgi:hypothetical protein